MQKSCNPILTLGGRVRQGTTLGALAAVAAGSALVFGWDSLVALGLSSLIIALLPCLVMCALGLCALRMGRKGLAAQPAIEVVEPEDKAAAANTASPAKSTS